MTAMPRLASARKTTVSRDHLDGGPVRIRRRADVTYLRGRHAATPCGVPAAEEMIARGLAHGRGGGGLRWAVRVRTHDEVRQEEAGARERARMDGRSSAEAATREAILAHLARPENRRGDSATGIARGVGRSKSRDVEALLGRMVESGALAVAGVRKGRRACEGYRLAAAGDPA